jgi:VIT1/CCC1 family predicted Fe2+/Mn2+ transporter
MQSTQTKSIPSLFGEAIEQLGRHFGTEVQLAKAELSERISRAEQGLAYLAAAAVLMIPVVVVLLLTLALWLSEFGLSPVLAHLAAALLGALLSVVLGICGLGRLKAKSLKLTKTAEQVNRDVALARSFTK